MRRLVWWAALAAIAFVTVCIQIDRESDRSPAWALAVPEPFRSNAQLAHAGLATMTAEPAIAVREAQVLVRRRPVPADHLFMLAMARLRAGDSAAFEKTITLATTRGWRSEGVQLIAARAAIQQRDVSAAANRIIALRAIGSRSPDLADMTRAVLAMPDGPETIGRRVAASGLRGSIQLGVIARAASPDEARRMFAAAALECRRKFGNTDRCDAFAPQPEKESP